MRRWAPLDFAHCRKRRGVRLLLRAGVCCRVYGIQYEIYSMPRTADLGETENVTGQRFSRRGEHVVPSSGYSMQYMKCSVLCDRGFGMAGRCVFWIQHAIYSMPTISGKPTTPHGNVFLAGGKHLHCALQFDTILCTMLLRCIPFTLPFGIHTAAIILAIQPILRG